MKMQRFLRVKMAFAYCHSLGRQPCTGARDEGYPDLEP